jgi:hypothetical protein
MGTKRIGLRFIKDNVQMRTCTDCHKSFPETFDFFHYKRNGFRSVCRQCSYEQGKRRRADDNLREKRDLLLGTLKKCSCCKEEKLLDLKGTNFGRYQGYYASKCKECAKKTYAEKERLIHPEKYLPKVSKTCRMCLESFTLTKHSFRWINCKSRGYGCFHALCLACEKVYRDSLDRPKMTPEEAYERYLRQKPKVKEWNRKQREQLTDRYVLNNFKSSRGLFGLGIHIPQDVIELQRKKIKLQRDAKKIKNH